MADDHAWEIQARARIQWLRAEVREAARRAGGSLDQAGSYAGPEDAYQDAFGEILARLADAEVRLAQKANAANWLRGTRIESAWASIHSAHARLFEIVGDDQLWALVPDVRTAAAAYLPEKDPWRKAVDEWVRRAADRSGARREITDYDRELLSNALRRAYDANAERYTQLRRFRNILLGTAGLFAVLTVVLCVVGGRAPSVIPLCFDVEENVQACPTGKAEPGAWDVTVVAVMGLLGGAIGGARSLTRSSRATVSSYTLRVARAALKVSLGGAAAVVGLIFLSAGFAPGFDGLSDQKEILGYAFVFGASQQLLTKLADQQAEAVLKSASSENESDEADAG